MHTTSPPDNNSLIMSNVIGPYIILKEQTQLKYSLPQDVVGWYECQALIHKN